MTIEQSAEEKFLTGMEQAEIPVEALLEMLESLVAEGKRDQANDWAELLIDSLSSRKDGPGVLKTLESQLGWNPASEKFNRVCRSALREVFRDRLSVAMLDAAGVGVLPAAEALRRFRLLRDCRPGTFCREKTWGSGKIRDLDEFYQKITIDFMRRRGHQLTFEYAAETLELLPGDHILARAFSDGPALRKAVAGDPTGTVVEVLREMGPMSVDQLENFFSAHEIVESSAWKKFWDKARTGLMERRLVEFPSRKNQRLKLRQPEDASDAPDKIDALGEMRDPAEIFKQIARVLNDQEVPSGKDRDVILDRVNFALTGVRNSNPALYARLSALAYTRGLVDLDFETLRDDHRDSGRLIGAARKIPAREMAGFCDFLLAGDKDGQWMLEMLPRLPLGMVEELAQRFLREPELAARLNSRLRESLNSVDAPLTLIVWACRHVDAVEAGGVIAAGDLLAQAVAGIENARSGEELRMQNLIRKAFENLDWLQRMMRDMSDLQRRGLLERVQVSRGWDATSRRGVMAGMIKLFPDLENQTAKSSVTEANPAPKRVTSWRSYRLRQARLKKLVEEEIPANSREIGVARSYGDLRENFEYHAARHQQGLLMRRRAELEKELTEVDGTDFADVSVDKVAPGVTLTLTRNDGNKKQSSRLTILGEWDRDEPLAIISCRSRVGELLEGVEKGARVSLPEGEMSVTEIAPLAPEIRAWIQADGAADA